MARSSPKYHQGETACLPATATVPAALPEPASPAGSSTTISANFPDLKRPDFMVEPQPLRIAARRHAEELQRRRLVARQHLHLVGLAQGRQHGISRAAAHIGRQRNADRPFLLAADASCDMSPEPRKLFEVGQCAMVAPASDSRWHSLSDKMNAMGQIRCGH